MIEFIDIQKTYGAGTIHEIKALEPLNLKIMDGEFVVLIGSNGSGKSTLFNLLAGSTQPDKGQILINKTDISHLPEHQRCLYLSRIFQDPLSGTASELSILDNFRLAALRTRKKTLKIGTSQIFRKIIKDRIAGLNLGLESKIDQPVGTLSGGQRQALTLLMAVMDSSQILLMDEPTAALDPGTSRVIMEIAGRIIREEGLTAILITHQVKDVLRYGDRLIQMKEGKILRDLNKTQKQGIQVNEVLGWFGE
ncbi:MAG TPA: ATP-binding cassette domain-containing protein [Bacteroidia bacterium]|nr:ATP-binding cassette domain-containing protein [Bacteroidia bacterium]